LVQPTASAAPGKPPRPRPSTTASRQEPRHSSIPRRHPPRRSHALLRATPPKLLHPAAAVALTSAGGNPSVVRLRRRGPHAEAKLTSSCVDGPTCRQKPHWLPPPACRSPTRKMPWPRRRAGQAGTPGHAKMHPHAQPHPEFQTPVARLERCSKRNRRPA
jgi:hypothetical protein